MSWLWLEDHVEELAIGDRLTSKYQSARIYNSLDRSQNLFSDLALLLPRLYSDAALVLINRALRMVAALIVS